MSWEDFITHILTTTTKVEKLAVYDGRGRPVTTTNDMETTESEGFALLKCLTDPSKTMTKLCVDNTMFLCVQGIDHTFVGTSPDNSSRVIVARSDGDHLIVLIGHAEERGSFISELTRALHLKAEGRLIGQDQLRQSQQLIPVDNSNNMMPPSASTTNNGTSTTTTAAVVAAEQVLVDITG